MWTLNIKKKKKVNNLNNPRINDNPESNRTIEPTSQESTSTLSNQEKESYNMNFVWNSQTWALTSRKGNQSIDRWSSETNLWGFPIIALLETTRFSPSKSELRFQDSFNPHSKPPFSVQLVLPSPNHHSQWIKHERNITAVEEHNAVTILTGNCP